MQDLRVQAAVVLMAGRGVRLGAMTADRPKALVRVAGCALFERLLGQLRCAGIGEVTLVVGYRQDAVEALVGVLPASPVLRLVRNPRFDVTNTGASVALALEVIAATRDRVLICDGDLLLRSAATLATLLSHREPNVVGTALDAAHLLGDEEVKLVLGPPPVGAALQRIRQLGKWLDPASAQGEAMGIQILSAPTAAAYLRAFRALAPEQADRVYYEDVFHHLIAAGEAIHAAPVPDADWIEIDTPEDMSRARRLLRAWAEQA